MFGRNEIVGKKYFENISDKYLITSLFYTLQGEGPLTGTPSVFIRFSKCNLACNFCFTENTIITLANGKYKKIQEIEVGDEVSTFDEFNKKIIRKKVTKIYRRQTDNLIKIISGKNIIECTPEHPFYSVDAGWVKASDIKCDDKLLIYNNYKLSEEPVLIKTNFINEKKNINVYNLEVEDTHNYVANGFVVHNCDTYFDSGDVLTLEEINLKIDILLNQYFNNDIPEWAQNNNKKRDMAFIITGGEPMLQNNIVNLIDNMKEQFKYVQIETNGTQYQNIDSNTILVVSPKCSEKNGVAIKYLKPRDDILKRANCLKFVVSSDQNSPYSKIPDWAINWKKETGKDIYISPMNIYNDEPRSFKEKKLIDNYQTIEQRSVDDEVISFWTEGLLNLKENEKNHKYAANYALKIGAKFQIQTHLYAGLA